MRFQLLDIPPNIENPVTGRIVSTADRHRPGGDGGTLRRASGFQELRMVTCAEG